MKRILLLTVALLGVNYLMRSEADTGPTGLPVPPSAPVPPAAAGDRDCCATGGLSRAAMLSRSPEGEGTRDSCAMTPDAEGFPDTEQAFVPPAATRGVSFVVSDLMAAPERAEADAETKLRRAIAAWLVPDARADWAPPPDLIRSVVLDRRLRQFDRDYAEVHQATLKVDLSPAKRAEFQRAYERDEGMKRMGWLGAVVAFVLALLAILAGYIRTDEATKGYYTNRLRLAAAAGAGAAGLALYQFLT